MRKTSLLVFGLCAAVHARAELKLPAVIGSHMVLQQNQSDPIWGWDAPGTKVTVTFGAQSKSAEAGADGKWLVKLDPMPANDQPQTMVIAGSEQKELQDVLVGEVWVCSGQSNMGFTLARDLNGDLEVAASKHPQMRLFKVPLFGTQEPQKDVKAEWKPAGPENSGGFTAVGFMYGRYLHEVLHVPVGLIDDAWGGSAAEAWIRRSELEKDARFKLLMENTVKRETELQSDKAKQDYQAALEKWKEAAAKAKAEGKVAPRQPQSPDQWLAGNQRPGNIFNGVLLPTIGYGIKGAIWYQGESNAGRAWEYAQLFPFMIEQWRKEWGQGDFPFYWVQLADFKAEQPEPGDADYAELRESQTKTMKLPNTGQAVIIDLGEGKDIHPRNKHDVAARLVRWPLATLYGVKVPFRSPEFKSMEVHDGKVQVKFDTFGSTLRTFDVADVRGFAVCGDDKKWHWAKAALKGKDTVELTCDQVEYPTSVRYAWADNPVCNLYSEEGLPATPFRTDDFEMITKPK